MTKDCESCWALSTLVYNESTVILLTLPRPHAHPWTKWPPFRRQCFQMHFYECKLLCFDSNCTNDKIRRESRRQFCALFHSQAIYCTGHSHRLHLTPPFQSKRFEICGLVHEHRVISSCTRTQSWNLTSLTSRVFRCNWFTTIWRVFFTVV